MKINKEAHKDQFTLGDLAYCLARAQRKYPDNWQDIPVYLGDDDELNGIHCCWYGQLINGTSSFAEMINDDGSNNHIEKDEDALLLS